MAYIRSWRLALALSSIFPCLVITGGIGSGETISTSRICQNGKLKVSIRVNGLLCCIIWLMNTQSLGYCGSGRVRSPLVGAKRSALSKSICTRTGLSLKWRSYKYSLVLGPVGLRSVTFPLHFHQYAILIPTYSYPDFLSSPRASNLLIPPK